MRYRIAAIAALSAVCACSVNPAADVTPEMLQTLVPAPAPQAETAPPPFAATETEKSIPPPRAAGAIAQPPQAAAPAPKQAEQVTVTDAPSVGGIWEIVMPHSVTLTLPGNFTYGNIMRNLCRFVQKGDVVSGNCLTDKVQPVRGSFVNHKVRVSFGPAIFTGTVTGTNRMQGGLRMGIFGFGLSPAVPIAGRRRAPGTPAPARVMDALRNELKSRPTHPDSAAHIDANLQGLGPLEKLSYIDTVPLLIDKDAPPEQLNVFTADFDSGTRLCGISLTQGNKIKRLLCG